MGTRVSMISRYIFLDRDGTIIKDKHHMYKSEDIEFLPGAIEGLRQLQQLGFECIIVTNQAGVRKGYFTRKDAQQFHQQFLHRLKQQGVIIKKSYFCFHREEDGCNCRKPKIGLVQKASKAFDIQLGESIFIGDKDCDIGLGKNCSGRTILIQNNQYSTITQADFAARDLLDVYRILKKEML